ncbi:hypothetical protein [Bacillus cytotoxicus]|uniref:Uncharacterized protein n=2 Tax=Bacillus cytotoxicus TaxID=580165 RepID=A7GSS5_BACCN|nr:hypothetical protein [Bacillus cytotoxicus]ABS23183.1 hypothetical protein Bcer98_2952 [Bacillus cytotoxicus NVH 391-98]AWC33277.1 hypothetical protein CG482_013415 [Bacillus cytotoxicus]AWC33835.1 hypothetical protein CG482_016470 [Bacillus cytotoxicus]AWC37826.1 hypothetical protein CG481_016300 [Bacillus cytotoxicus]AWC46924.1 hypothetical protein CG479_015715 [Bacillus cytotoxicus]
MKYFEFNKHEYYALIAVNGDVDKAIEIYVENVAGDSAEQVKEEAVPVELTREQALSTYLVSLARPTIDTPINKLHAEFCDCEDSVLLIDGSLAS